MFGFEGELQVYYVGALQSHHNVSLVCDYALLTTLKQALFLHQLEGIESPCIFEPCQKDTAETSCANAFDYFEVFELNVIGIFLFPDGLDLEQLSLEDSDGFVGLKIIVFEDVSSSSSLPVADGSRTELWIP